MIKKEKILLNKMFGMSCLFFVAICMTLGSNLLAQTTTTTITCPSGDRYKCYDITIGTPENPDMGTQTFRKGEGDVIITVQS